MFMVVTPSPKVCKVFDSETLGLDLMWRDLDCGCGLLFWFLR